MMEELIYYYDMFKINVTDFGPIKAGEFDIRPLTVLVGPNNTGKTYIAYFLNSIRGRLYDHKGRQTGPETEQEIAFIRKNLLDPLLKNKTASLDLMAYYDRFYLGDNFQRVCQQLAVNFPEEVLSIREKFADTVITVSLKEAAYTGFKARVNRSVISKVPIIGKPDILMEKSGSVNSCGFTVAGTVPRMGAARKNSLSSMLHYVFHLLFERYFFPQNELVLPSERTALVFAYKDIYKRRAEETLDVGANLRSHTLDRRGELLSKYPKPVVDFLRFMYELSDEMAESKTYQEVVRYIESNILDGRISLERSKGTKVPVMFFEYEKDKRIEIHAASSGTKSISPLLCYLQKAGSNDLLIIDEPEINLHPAAQMKLTVALTMAVNKGLKIIITTHSPYIVDPLNHLIRAYTASQKETKEGENVKEALQGKLGIPHEAFISKDMVSAYSFDGEGGVADVMDRETGVIDWGTFGRVTSDLYDMGYDVESL